MSNKLDFDTDFLDENTPAKVGGGGGGSSPNPLKPKKWRSWITGGVIVLGVIIMALASDSSSTSTSGSTYSPTYSSNPTDDVTVGLYRCSSSNARRADELEPDTPEATIKAESNALDRRIAALEAWGNRIENMYVDEYDQYSIDNYNNQVDSYNSTKDKLNFDISIYEAKLPRYNSQVDVYNNFLENNCTKTY